jgi:hypothetical protein
MSVPVWAESAPSDGKAVQHAGGVEEPLERVRGRGELLGGTVVDDEHRRGAVAGQPAGRPQRRDRVREVVHRLDRQHHLVAAGQRRVGGVGDGEADAVGDAGLRRIAARRLDRGRIDVEPVDAQPGVPPRQRDRRPALAAPQLGDRAAGPQPRVDVGDLRQPLLDELVGERGPVEAALGVLHGVGAVGDAAAVPVRVLERRQHPADGLQEAAEREEVRGALRIQENGLAAGEQPEAAGVGVTLRVVDGEQPRSGLLLAPLAGVAGVDPGGGGERRRSGGAAVGERAVEAEPRPEGHGGELEGAEPGLEQAAGQLAGHLLGRALDGGGGGRGGGRGHGGSVRSWPPRTASPPWAPHRM